MTTSHASSRASSSRVLSVNEFSMLVEGRRALADLLAKLDLARPLDRPVVARVKCNIPDSTNFDVRDFLGRVRTVQPANFEWHALALLESLPDPEHPGERTLYETEMRDHRGMSECAVVSFGRNSSNDWVLQDALISRFHGVVVLDDKGELQVVDGRQGETSTNGLYYMDRPPAAGRVQRLQHPHELVSFGPPIRFGENRNGFLFRIRVRWVDQP